MKASKNVCPVRGGVLDETFIGHRSHRLQPGDLLCRREKEPPSVHHKRNRKTTMYLHEAWVSDRTARDAVAIDLHIEMALKLPMFGSSHCAHLRQAGTESAPEESSAPATSSEAEAH